MFGLGSIARGLGLNDRKLVGGGAHARSLGYGNQMGLMPETDSGAVTEGYQGFLSEFEKTYQQLTQIPGDLTVDELNTMRLQDEEAKVQAELGAEYRQLAQAEMDRQHAAYNALVSAQAHAEGVALEVQQGNIQYLQNNIRGSLKAAENEARFGGHLAGLRGAANRRQELISFE